jgi:hypothetical protein
MKAGQDATIRLRTAEVSDICGKKQPDKKMGWRCEETTRLAHLSSNYICGF